MTTPPLANARSGQLGIYARAAIALLLAASMFAWVLFHGVPLLRSDLISLQARNQTNEWATAGQGWSVESWQSARQDLQAALVIAPDDPVLHVTLAQLYVTQGLVAWADLEQRTAYFEEALVHQQQALALRPTDGTTWASVAVSMFAAGRPLPEVQQAWAQATVFAPKEAPVQVALIDLALATWAQATPAMQAWVKATWQEAGPARKKQFEAIADRHGQAEVFR